MALNATLVWQYQDDGDATNGGGYDSAVSGAGTDYSLQAAAQLSLTDLAMTAGGTTLTSATGGFTAAMIGNLIHINSGTNFTAGWYMITARADTNTVTLDRDATTGSNGSSGVGKVGGALDVNGSGVLFSPILGTTQVAVAGNIVYIKAGTYTLTANDDIGADGGAAGPIQVVGYNTTRTITNTDATKPVITTSTNSVGVRLNAANSMRFANLKFTNTATTKVHAFRGITSAPNYIVFERIECSGGSAGLWNGATDNVLLSGAQIINCVATGCGGAVLTGRFDWVSLIGCWFYDNSAGAITTGLSSIVVIQKCVFDSNGADEIASTATGATVMYIVDSCTFNLSSGCDAVSFASNSSRNMLSFTNNIVYGNGGTCYGINTAETAADAQQCFVDLNNAFGNLTAARNTSSGSFTLNQGSIALAATPFTNAASDNFSLNTTAGGGAACRAAALDPIGLTGYADVGALQHADPTLPAITDVKSGTQYGAGGTEFTGTYVGGTTNLIIHAG